MLERLVEQAGYAIIGIADVAVNAERLLDYRRPDVIIVEHVLTGEQGWEALPHLRAASPDSKLLLVVADDWTPSERYELGAFAVITVDNLRQMVSDEADVHAWLEEKTATVFVDRRVSSRREQQDWSSVGYEKRDRPDRRQSTSIDELNTDPPRAKWHPG